VSREIVDVNVYIGRWPTRRIHGDKTRDLVDMLRDNDVREAWTGSFEALLHKDIAGVNARLVEECEEYGSRILKPFGTINLALPGWKEELVRCANDYPMLGVRLHPSYHGYTLNDERFTQFLQQATDYRLIVQIAVNMEDERMMHPRLQVPAVDLKPLREQILKAPKAKVVLLNAEKSGFGNTMEDFASESNVYFDIAMLEGIGSLGNLLQHASGEKIVYGSYAPFLYCESASLKLKESVLTPFQLKAVCFGNADDMVAKE
jgi:predicted TIM-barrel fold metal-dependent hydrolase